MKLKVVRVPRLLHVGRMRNTLLKWPELKKQNTLREKRTSTFSDEQLRSWAHMFVMKKHESLEFPPDKPFWKTPKTPTSNSSAVSPSKQINLRGQCVDQLLKWHELLEKGAIMQEQYEEFKSTILDDVNKF